MSYTTLNIRPIYSLYDLYRDLTRGRRFDFTYNGQRFNYAQNHREYKIYMEVDGRVITAISAGMPSSMIDIHAAAAGLLTAGHSITHDHDDNIRP